MCLGDYRGLCPLYSDSGQETLSSPLLMRKGLLVYHGICFPGPGPRVGLNWQNVNSIMDITAGTDQERTTHLLGGLKLVFPSELLWHLT